MRLTRSSIRRIFLASAVAGLALAHGAPAGAQTQSSALSVQKLKDLFASGVPAARLLAIARGACISFQLTPAIEAQLRAARFDATLIEGLRSVCYRPAVVNKPPVPPRPTPTPPRPTPTPPRPPQPQLASLQRGGEVTGTLTASDPTLADGTRYDEWTFSAMAGERLEINVHSDDFDPKMVVGRRVGSDFTEIERDDDSGEGLDARLIFAAPTSGTYAVRVLPFSTTLGRYTVRLGSAPQQRAPQTWRASRGQRVEGTIDASDATLDEGHPYEHWVINAQAGERLTIDVSSTDFDTHASIGEVRGGEFEQLASDDDGGEGTNSLISDWTAPRSGEFVVRVRPFGTSSSGRYTIAITSGAPSVAAGSINADIRLTNAPNDQCRNLSHTTTQRREQPVASYFVQIPASGTMRFTTENESPDPVMYIYSGSEANWSLLARDDDSGEGLRPLIVTPVSGGARHLVCLWSYGDQAGEMVLLASYDERTGPTVGAGPTISRTGRIPLRRGVAEVGTLAAGDSVHRDGSYIDQWEFSGVAGERVHIRLTSNAFPPYFAFFSVDSNGMLNFIQGSTGSTSTSTEATITLPHTGTFVVHANSHGAARTGPYTLTLQTLR